MHKSCIFIIYLHRWFHFFKSFTINLLPYDIFLIKKLVYYKIIISFADNKYIMLRNIMKKKLLFIALALGMFCSAHAQLPSITLKDINGKTVRTDTLSNNGKPLIIDFFATWCKPCNRELTAISEVYEDWQEETGVKLIAISIDQAQNINKVKPLVDSHEWPYEVLLDPNGDFKRALGIQMIPYTLIVDGKGNIVYKHNGYTEGAEQEIFEKVKELVNQ